MSTTVYESILDKLLDCGMDELVDDTSYSLRGKDNIFLDGELVGICRDSASFVTDLRNMRRSKELPHQVLCYNLVSWFEWCDFTYLQYYRE